MRATLELLGRPVPFPEQGYRGEYVIEYARSVVDEYDDRFLNVDKADAL